VDQFFWGGRSTDENLFTDYPRTKIPDLCVVENMSQKNRIAGMIGIHNYVRLGRKIDLLFT
jgi:hypothetical protein